MAEEEIGKIKHFFDKISVAVVELSSTLKVGDNIHIKGVATDFTQTIDSMQIQHDKVEEATKGQSIGLKTAEPVKVGDVVYKVTE